MKSLEYNSLMRSCFIFVFCLRLTYELLLQKLYPLLYQLFLHSGLFCVSYIFYMNFLLIANISLQFQPVILDYLASKTICSDDLVVVSPDVGGVARARAFAKKLSDAPLAIVDKRRHGHNIAEVRSTYL